jgi:hypothetical protein
MDTNTLKRRSILGPLFFLLFVIDLPLLTSNKITTLVLYADDTSMIVTGSNPVQFSIEISTNFDDIIEWFRINLMYLNYEETHYLQFQTKNSQKLALNITLADKHINTSTSIKFLGLTIDDKLSWKGHIGNVLKKFHLFLFYFIFVYMFIFICSIDRFWHAMPLDVEHVKKDKYMNSS